MYIKSELKELDYTLFELDLSDPGLEEEMLYHLNVRNSAHRNVAIHCDLYYTRGLCIIETSFYNRMTITDIFSIRGNYFRFTCMLNGNSYGRNNIARILNFNLGHVNLAYERDATAYIEMKAQKRIRYFAVIIDRNYYLKLFENKKWAEQSRIYRQVVNNVLLKQGKITFSMSPQMYQVIQSLATNGYSGAFRKFFTDIKLCELFLCIETELSDIARKRDISEEDFRKLETARAYLTLNHRPPPTIRELSRIVFLNELKLKNGFKRLYGTTVYAYVLQLRMEKARNELLGTCSVKEMADILGYKSVSHFIQAFKKFYGYTPKQALVEQVKRRSPG